jgi:methionine aminotransferase
MKIQSKLPRVGTTIFTVMSQLAAQHKAINLGQGFPDFDGPQALRDALQKHTAEGKNQYAPMIGVARLREQIAIKTQTCYQYQANPDTQITITSGATEAIFCAIAATVRTGDEVIVFDPCFDCYEPAIELQGAKTIHIPLTIPSFQIDWQRVRDAMTSRTRMIIINSPHNPSGAAMSSHDLQTLADLTRNTDIIVLSDEVYEHIIFDGQEHQSVLRHVELAARSFVVSSFGKTFHCTGWKLGYCIAPPSLTNELRKIHQYITFCSFHPAQWALADVLEQHPEHYQQLPEFYQAKRDLFRTLLAPSRFQLLDVAGGYFQVVDYSTISERDDLSFCEWLCIEKGIAAIPLSSFYETPPSLRLVRLCFAKTQTTLEQAAAKLTSI